MKMEKNAEERAILARKLEATLSGRARPIADAIRRIEYTGSLLDDYYLPTASLQFLRREVQDDVALTFKPDTYYGENPEPFTLHDHAVGQIGDKLGVPPAYLKTLVRGKDWQKELSLLVMQMSSDNTRRDKVLLRTVEGQVRGFLSDRYRRLDSMQIFIAFLQAARETGSVLVDAHSGETKGFLEVINPNIVEFDTPLNGRNYMAFGARIRNSDFGDGALEVYFFGLLVQCMNGLVGQSMLREFHLGGRIPDDIRVSEETYRKDTEAKASLVGDVMRQIYLPETTSGLIERIQGASAKQVDLVKEVERLPKLGLTVTEANAVGKVLMENDPANGLQGSPTLWKLVNGLTAVARDAEPERKRELELIASDMLK